MKKRMSNTVISFISILLVMVMVLSAPGVVNAATDIGGLELAKFERLHERLNNYD